MPLPTACRSQPGLADDAHQMDVLIKALEERVTSLIIMGPESISAEVR